MSRCEDPNCTCNQVYFGEGEKKYLSQGDIILLGRFESRRWMLHHGWFSFGGNRPFCGWYMVSQDSKHEVRPLQKPDLLDIHIVERGGRYKC